MARRRSRKGSAGIKKDPVVRALGETPKPLRRSKRNAVKTALAPKRITVPSYDSPLGPFLVNSSTDTPSTSKTPVKQEVKEEVTDDQVDNDKTVDLVDNEKVDTIKEDLDDEFSKLTFDFLNSSSSNKEEEANEENEDHTNDSTEPTKRKKKSIHARLRSGEKIDFNKKVKLKKKSLLSSFRGTNKLTDSLVLLDDSDNETKPLLNESVQSITSNSSLVKSEKLETKPLLTEPVQSTEMGSAQSTSKNSEPADSNVVKPSHFDTAGNSEDIVIVDCNDSLQVEMNAYHDKFNQSTKPAEICSDSIIILDDEPSGTTTNEAEPTRQEQTPKTNEDCFVVWSSMPTTSTADPIRRVPPPNSNILKQDKILLDTSPDMSNYRFLNNENNKPKKKIMKPPKGGKNPMKSMLERTKAIANKTEKSAAEVANKVVSKSNERCTTKTTGKRKAKASEDLIYISDKEDGKAAKKAKKGKLREIVVDGSNIGMAYTNNKVFSEKGIKMLIDYFTKRGHTVKVFIPQYRRSYSFPLLEKWYKDGIVVFTPSRKIGGKQFTPYDDRYILEYATTCDGIVVSQDQFRDLYQEKPQYRDTIENRLLVPTFVGDYVMFPEDPLGRDGPALSDFLRH